jgi:hypothetical protein
MIYLRSSKILTSLLLFTITALLLATASWADVKSTTGQIEFDAHTDGSSEMTLNSTGLGIGVSPSTNLHVNGNAIITEQLFIGGSSGSANLNLHGTIGYRLVSVSENTILSDDSIIMVDSSSDNIIITLPYAGNILGRTYTIKKIDTANIVQLSSSNLIDNSDYFNLSSGNTGSVSVISDGSKWLVLSQYDASLAWTPSEITTSLWLDANDTSTIHTGSSSNVYQWDDLSGNDYHVVSSGNNPVFNNERIMFSGSANYLATSTNLPFGSGNAYSLFAVNAFSVDQDGSGTPLGVVVGYGNGSASTGIIFARTNAYHTWYEGANSGQVTASMDGNLELANFEVAPTAGGPNAALIVNGDTPGGTFTVTDTGTDGPFYLGGINGSSYRDFEGDISEVIILPYVPSESVRQRIEGYLAHKWGFTSKLPMDHPYKNLAP